MARPKLTDKKRWEIARLYKAGDPVKIIAFEYGITTGSITDIVRARGVPMRRSKTGAR
jgi:hypothetical protein